MKKHNLDYSLNHSAIAQIQIATAAQVSEKLQIANKRNTGNPIRYVH